MSNFVKDFISYNLGSVNKQIFIDFARDTSLSAFHIYRLSKGKVAKSGKDFNILHQLKEKGIISGIRYR